MNPSQYHNNTNDEVCYVAWKWSWMSLIDTLMWNLRYTLTALLSCTKEACKDCWRGEKNSGLCALQFMVKERKHVTQACRPTALKRTDERIKNCIKNVTRPFIPCKLRVCHVFVKNRGWGTGSKAHRSHCKTDLPPFPPVQECINSVTLGDGGLWEMLEDFRLEKDSRCYMSRQRQ